MFWTYAPRLVGFAVAACAATGCGFQASTTGFEAVAIDSSIDVYIPDAGQCEAFTTECIGSGSTLRACTTLHADPVDTPCTWGCLTAGGAHCGALQPSGGTLTAGDLDPSAALSDVTIPTKMTTTIDTMTGEITGVREPGAGVVSGIDFQVRGAVGVFKFNKLTVAAGTIAVKGPNALALVSVTDMTIGATLDLQGDCTGSKPGPGGAAGGDKNDDANGSGKGARGLPLLGGGCVGGGGGAGGGDGGNSAVIDNHGRKFGTDAITALIGGGGGGGGYSGGQGANGPGGEGGGGGGAIQLVANDRVTITGGGIQAGGCGGKANDECGGGGGAGGTVLIEAAVVDFIDSKLAVNGGGGAGGDNGVSGQSAQLSATRANGGAGGNSGSLKGGNGGDGGDDQGASGGIGQPDSRCGAGGGGVGRMRFNSLSGGIVTSGTIVFSPNVSTTGATTTVTKGQATVR